MPNMAKYALLAHIWVRKIWWSEVSRKRSCKMQFRHVGLRSIGPSSQKLWPNQFFCRSPHCNYNIKLEMGAIMWLSCMGLYLLKIVLVAHPTYEKISGVSGIPKFRLLVFLGHPNQQACLYWSINYGKLKTWSARTIRDRKESISTDVTSFN